MFYLINLSYPLWVMHVVSVVPEDLKTPMTQALFGFTNKMHAQLAADLKTARSKVKIINRKDLKQGLSKMAGFIKTKKTDSELKKPVGREIELAPSEI
jgi:hypothetical protein